MKKIRLATIWLDGCSGCHMSFLDIDERLIELSDRVELVFSPLVDAKEFPEDVDITLVEGALGTEEDLHKIRKIRERTKLLVAFGDCAVTANIPSMRNPFGRDEMLKSLYVETDALNPQVPAQSLPELLPRALPLHHYVHVDVFLPGCPPSANTIYQVLTELIEGRIPDVNTLTRFGA
ncbi:MULTISPECIES: NADP oxidoreductase [Anaerolinea]|uniref:NADH-quinone oxidoreductase subunit B family protein n=1 Tax=Anaerolinea TaxID=233189 RepID=UPI00260D5886|nr:NADP oxidoreductase [Anaerolinea thermophila]